MSINNNDNDGSAAKLIADNKTITSVTNQIAVTSAGIIATLKDTVKKGNVPNLVSNLTNTYSKLRETFSKTIDNAIETTKTLKNGDKVKDTITGAIKSITDAIASTSDELKKKIPNIPVLLGPIKTATDDSITKFRKLSTELNKKIQPYSSYDFSLTSIYSELSALYTSSNIIARLTFLLLILFVFILLLRIGTSIITWAFSHSTSPILLDGMINSKQMVQIPQNPAVSGAIPILRSVNDDFGIGFTWSVWINIDDFTYKEKEYKHVFHKGNDNINLSTPPIGMNLPNNSPGLYIAPDKNDLVVVMNTFDSITEEVRVKDIPLNKWVCVIIRVNEQKQMDVYINGNLTRRHILPSIPKQNYGDVYVSMNGGFSGNTASLRYYAYPIGTNEIQSLVSAGPNTKMISSGGQMNGDSMDYLATRWFFQPNM